MASDAATGKGYVYILVHPDERREGHYTKIGYSRLHPEKESNGSSKPRKAHLEFTLEAFGLGKLDMPLCEPHSAAKFIERRLHKHFSERRRANTGSSKEVFDVAPEEVIERYWQEANAMVDKNRSPPRGSRAP